MYVSDMLVWHDANVNTSSDKENDFMWVMMHTSKESLLDVHYKLVGPEKFVIVTLQDATEMMSCFALQHKYDLNHVQIQNSDLEWLFNAVLQCVINIYFLTYQQMLFALLIQTAAKNGLQFPPGCTILMKF